MQFDTKIAVLVRDDLETWQRLNVTAFLASGIAANPELLGEPYADADGTPYLPMLRQPVLVFAGQQGGARRGARARGPARAADRRLHLRHVQHRPRRGEPGRGPGRARAQLDLVGLAVHGPRNAVDKVLKGATLHK